MSKVEIEREAPPRILIVAHVRLYRDGLVSILEDRERFRVVGAVDSCPVAIHQCKDALPDVVIIDMSTPDALNTVSTLSRDVPGTKILAFAIREEESQIIACVEAGAAGYVTCQSSVDDLFCTIEAI